MVKLNEDKEMIRVDSSFVTIKGKKINLKPKENLDNLFDESMLHNFSLRLVYYIDYNKAKNWL